MSVKVSHDALGPRCGATSVAPGDHGFHRVRAYEKQLLSIRENIRACLKALRALKEAKAAEHSDAARKRRLMQGLSYWLVRRSKVRSDRDAALVRHRVLPVPRAASSQVKVRRFGLGSQHRPYEPDCTRFTKEHPATWFSI